MTLTASGADLFAALVPDRDVRVSVKALALSCVGAAVALHPESFFSRLYRAPLDSVECPGAFSLCPAPHARSLLSKLFHTRTALVGEYRVF